MTAAAAFGVILKRDSTAVVGLKEADPPEGAADDVDVTTHESTGGIREFISALIDNGEFNGVLEWDPGEATQVQIRTDFYARTQQTWHIVIPDAGDEDAAFTAHVSKWKVNTPLDGDMTADFTLRVSGPITYS